MFGEGIAADHLRHTWLKENYFSRGQPEQGADLAEELVEMIMLHDASNIAAVIVEPMAGSAGVFPPPVGYLDRLREICDQHDILLISTKSFAPLAEWERTQAPKRSTSNPTSSTSK